jgi:putative DNA primase/helicase
MHSPDSGSCSRVENNGPNCRDGSDAAASDAGLIGHPVRYTVNEGGVERAFEGRLRDRRGDFWVVELTGGGSALVHPARILGLDGTPLFGGPTSFTLVTTLASDVRPLPVDFLDGGLIPRGKLITIAGLGGAGKGMLWANVVADLTQGRPTLGLDYTPQAPIDVLLVGCEDGYADTVIPRLMAADADLSRIHILEGVKDAKGKILPFSLANLPALDAYLAGHPSIALVVIDPITGYVGRAGVQDHHDAEVRSLLEPLAELANRRSTTIWATKHLNKDEAKTLASRVSGSVAYVNVARACFVVADDPQSEGLRILSVFKWNLNAPRPSSIAWRMEALPGDQRAEILARPICEHLTGTDKAKLGEQLNRLVWCGPVEVAADDLLKSAAKTEPKAARAETERAAEWLEARLKDGPVGAVLCARDGDRFLGRKWPGPDLAPDERRPQILGRVKWWRESVLKAKLSGESRRAGFGGPYLFLLPGREGHDWPPPPDAVNAAINVDDPRDAVGGPPPSEFSFANFKGFDFAGGDEGLREALAAVPVEDVPVEASHEKVDPTASTASTTSM